MNCWMKGEARNDRGAPPVAEPPFLSRDEILGGRLAIERRAGRVMNTIEARVSHMRTETRHAVEALFNGTEGEFTRTFGDDYLRSLKMGLRAGDAPSLADIERFTRHWRQLVPLEAEPRAALIQALADRFRASPESSPHALAATGYGEAEVHGAYARLYGTSLDEALRASATQPEWPVRPAVSADDDAEEMALREAEAAVEWMSVPAGTVLIREGDSPDYLYFIVSGRLRVTATIGSALRVITDVGRGEIQGEMGVLTGEVRTASVTAMRDSEVVRLPQAEVLRMVYQSPRMLLRMNQILARRLRVEMAHTPRVPSLQMTIAVIPLSPDAPVRELTRAMVRVLERIGTVSHIDLERCEREFPRSGADADVSVDGELLAWLSEQESRHQFVVYEVSPLPGAWTDLCIRQADRIALVAAPGAKPDITAADRRVAELNASARQELVLIRGAVDTRPTDTRLWLQLRNVTTHHNVVLSEPSHIARFARRISGHAVGLVLGGGGARGYAHIGAWRALEEAGIPIDIVGGTSVGAIMAAGMAMDRTPDQMEELGRLFATARLKDLTLPLVSFFSSHEITRLLRANAGNVRIEDLWRKFFAISTSLTRAEPVVHTKGPVWQAARASAAIPGLFSPVPTADGDLLVDGAIMNNVPVDVMREMCERGPVIAINLSARAETGGQYGFGASVSGWRVLWSRLNPLAATIQTPSIFSTLLRTNEAGSTYRMRTSQVLSQADLLINPPVEQYRLFDFGSHRELIGLGYAHISAVLETWITENPEFKKRFVQAQPL